MSTLAIILIVVLALVVFGGWYGVRGEQFGPAVPGILGVVLAVVLILVLLGKI